MSPARYAVAEVADWAARERPLIVDPLAAFRAAADELEIRSSLDVDEALVGMALGCVHDTQLRVSAALVAAGRTDDEIVQILMDATRKAAGKQGARWDWQEEEQTIRGLCRSAREKFEPKIVSLARAPP